MVCKRARVYRCGIRGEPHRSHPRFYTVVGHLDDAILVPLGIWLTVRREYQAGHIPGAINMFIQEIPARLHELPRDGEVVFQCWHGVTSMDAAGFAIQNGWSAEFVRSLSGGIAGWVEAHDQEALVAE